MTRDSMSQGSPHHPHCLPPRPQPFRAPRGVPIRPPRPLRAPFPTASCSSWPLDLARTRCVLGGGRSARWTSPPSGGVSPRRGEWLFGRLAVWLFDGQRAARTWTAGAGALRRVHTCALVLAPTCEAGRKAALSRNEHDGATRDAPAVCAVPCGGRGALGTGLVRAEACRCVKSLPGLKDFV